MQSETIQIDRPEIDDPLSYLPCSAITEHPKGTTIYDAANPPSGLYLVLNGLVKVSACIPSGEVVIDVRQPDEFFGEIGTVEGISESATALEDSSTMSWSQDQLDELILRHPRLGLALVKLLVGRCRQLGGRVASISLDSAPCRLAKAILHFASQLGRPHPSMEGTILLPHFTHSLLAQYIGSRREAVTHSMNMFRRQGMVSYSRRDLIVNTAAVRSWLEATENQELSLNMKSPAA